MAHSRYDEPMDIIPTVIILLAVTLILQGFVIRHLNRQVGNLASRLHHAEVSISRMKADISALESVIAQQDEEHRMLREELETVKE